MSKSNESYCVYIHTNLINNKQYVGQTKRSAYSRWGEHGENYCRTNKHGEYTKFGEAIIEYGWDNFSHEIIFDNLTSEEADVLEISLINELDTFNNGYNSTLGGKGEFYAPWDNEDYYNQMVQVGKKLWEDQEFIDKMSLLSKQRWLNFDTREYMIKRMKESWQDEELKKRFSKIRHNALKKVWERPEYRQFQSENMSKRNKEELWTKPEFREMHIQQMKKRWENGELQKICKPVICIDTGIVYNSVNAASRDTHISNTSIIACCKGKCESVKGTHWQYQIIESDGDNNG